MHNISSDRPATSLEQDRYGLSVNFIPRLARLAVEWPAHDGLVIGVFGSWGLGKTSILHMFRDYVRREQEKYKNVLVATFNPWFYEDTGALITAFFATIAAELGSDTRPARTQAASTFKAVGKFLTVASKGFSLFGASFDPGIAQEALKAATDALNGVGEVSGGFADLADRGQKTFDELREKIEHELTKLGNELGRIVLLIDDVDRLNKAELLSLLRLIRIVADLPHMTLVVAMDDERVRDVLKEAASEGYGQGFLDKIIQVPLHVPLPSDDTITAELGTELAKVLDKMGFPKEPELQVGSYELRALASLIRTPRDLVRYVNGLRAFLLAGVAPDIHPVDAAFIEALRIFHPDVYDRVRRNKTFLTELSERVVYADPPHPEAEEQARSEDLARLIRGGRSHLDVEEEQSIRMLLRNLFGDVTNPAPQHSRLSENAAKRRIRSSVAFDHYFRYAQTPGVIPRRKVMAIAEQLRTHAEANSEQEIVSTIKSDFRDLDEPTADRVASDLGVELSSFDLNLLERIGHVVCTEVEQLGQDVAFKLLASVLTAIAGTEMKTGADGSQKSGLLIRHRIVKRAITSPLSISRVVLLATKKVESSSNEEQSTEEQGNEIFDSLLLRIDKEVQTGALFKNEEAGKVRDIVWWTINTVKARANRSPLSLETFRTRLVEHVVAHPESLPKALVAAASSSTGVPRLIDPFRAEHPREVLSEVFGDYKRLQPAYDAAKMQNTSGGHYRQLLADFGDLL